MADKRLDKEIGVIQHHTIRPQRAGFPLTLKLFEAALPMESWLKISQVRTLSVERIGERIGRVDGETLARVLEGFNEICG